jgi:hypothetical protein
MGNGIGTEDPEIDPVLTESIDDIRGPHVGESEGDAGVFPTEHRDAGDEHPFEDAIAGGDMKLGALSGMFRKKVLQLTEMETGGPGELATGFGNLDPSSAACHQLDSAKELLQLTDLTTEEALTSSVIRGDFGVAAGRFELAECA